MRDEDRPDLIEEAMLRAQGLMHVSDALLFEATEKAFLEEVIRDCQAELVKLAPRIADMDSEEEIRDLLDAAVAPFVARIDERLAKLKDRR